MKKIPIATAVFLVAASVIITYQVTYSSIEKKYSETVYTLSSENARFGKLEAIDELVKASYINDVNEETLEKSIIYGYLYGIGDKYASYLTAEEYERYTEQSNGSQTGLGITVIYDSSLGGMYITSVDSSAPAATAGIQAGDIIYAVDGETVTERGYYGTINYITGGKEGEYVTVSVKRGADYSETAEYKIARAKIKTHTVTYQLYEDNIGYIKISSFNSTTPTEFTDAMEELENQGAQAYIFDVRNNSGGALNSVASVLDYLLPEGPIIRIYTKTGETSLSSDEKCIDAPMAVIVNENTASAAELFSSALRDYEKAKLIGTTTYGKGTMQTMQKLSDESGGGAVSFSTGMYNPPKSDNYEGIGLTPDIEVKLTDEQAQGFYLLTLEQDPQFTAALETVKTTLR